MKENPRHPPPVEARENRATNARKTAEVVKETTGDTDPRTSWDAKINDER